MPSFYDFPLQRATQAALANMGITEPTPIQAEAIPVLLAGNDVVGQSATGSGKTLAYGIPLVERVAKHTRVVQALVLMPTRELAIQVHAVLDKLAASRRLSTALLVGGRAYGSQLSALRYGAQIVIGTPGRVKDHLDRGTLVLSQLRMCVLDEADQMLDSGFAPEVEEILASTPDKRHMALFSATMPDWIATLEEKFLNNPVKINIALPMGVIEQIAYQVPGGKKMAALCTLLHATKGESSLIFGKTKFGVEKLGTQLSSLGFTVGTLHGNKSQRAREEVLRAFRLGQVQTLLATNVAARGLDIQGISQVINYELPESSDLFTHRIGRTGRMGRQGKAITLLGPSDVGKWRRMARRLGQEVVLQRLAIDEQSLVTPPLPRPEAPRTQELEQHEKPRPLRDRTHLSAGQQRGRQAQPEHDGERAPSKKRRQKERVTSETAERTPAWQLEDSPLPERPYSGTASNGSSGRHAQPEFDHGRVSGKKRRQEERITSATPRRTSARQPEGIPLSERPYSRRPSNGRRGVGEQSRFGRTTRKHEAHSFEATAPYYRTVRRKPRATPVAQGRRRTSAANRSASR
ncbi:MAG: DEAD/DEAH box helicase [Chloroflexi bacterium]|nr:DEAD/DEAH box helicase [Chloroflexota bacterium]